MRKRKKAFFLGLCCCLGGVLFFSACAKSPGTSGPSTFPFKVMTLNIRYEDLHDGENAWSRRREMVSGTILFFQADIVGLQEALISQIRDLERDLPAYAWTGVGREDGEEAGEFSPIFYLEEKFLVLDASTFWLSESPDEPGLLGWDAACPRIVTWIHVKDKASDLDFYVFNTHFDHMGATARTESARLLRRRIEEIAENRPVFLLGDFNCTERSEPYKIITSADGSSESALRDARYLSLSPPYGSTFSFNGFSLDIRSPRLPIDHIFVRGMTAVLRWGLISERWDGRFISDHYPVFAEIQLAR